MGYIKQTGVFKYKILTKQNGKWARNDDNSDDTQLRWILRLESVNDTKLETEKLWIHHIWWGLQTWDSVQEVFK